jgi:single-strand DNA-binding protein
MKGAQMTEQIAVSGLVATTPREVVTSDGLAITSFRLASSKRRFDRSTGNWVDAETNWFSVVAFRQLAKNMSSSISKGDRVVLFGKLKVRDWDNGERSGTAVEIEASSIGHDLMFGVSSFVRVKPKSEEPAEVEEAQEDSEAELQPA